MWVIRGKKVDFINVLLSSSEDRIEDCAGGIGPADKPGFFTHTVQSIRFGKQQLYPPGQRIDIARLQGNAMLKQGFTDLARSLLVGLPEA